MTAAAFGRVRLSVFCQHGCASLLDGRPGAATCWIRLAAHNRHRARSAALIMWRTGLRVSEVLELEWRDLDYSGDPATLLVRKSKTRRHILFRCWPGRCGCTPSWCACSPTGRRTGRRGTSWCRSACGRRSGTSAMGSNGRASTKNRTLGTGKRRAGAHSLRHSAARHWLMVGKVPLNVVSAWLGHANVQVTLGSGGRIYLPIVGSDYSMDAVP